MSDTDDDLLVAKLIHPDAYYSPLWKEIQYYNPKNAATSLTFNRYSDATCVALMEGFRQQADRVEFIDFVALVINKLYHVDSDTTFTLPEAVFQCALKIVKENV